MYAFAYVPMCAYLYLCMSAWVVAYVPMCLPMCLFVCLSVRICVCVCIGPCMCLVRAYVCVLCLHTEMSVLAYRNVDVCNRGKCICVEI